ncbi:hypothetical protein EB796_024458 [Bugula neritina]|uniref:ShKT domain-containing protein n=1 Tax=Bugula neritina TaxID=10212 RepID=A0A7J7IUJ1_BUGNE|nr:hypothetical protein EB796_024458 [Bugula neritina]
MSRHASIYYSMNNVLLFTVLAVLLISSAWIGSANDIGEESLIGHLKVFFNSWVQSEHGGSGSIKSTSLFGRQIQLHVYKISVQHLSGTVQATVSVTDQATGKSVTKTAQAAKEQDATMNAGTAAAYELFTILEKEGLVKQSDFLRDNQVQLCDDVMRLSTCQIYAKRGMCSNNTWHSFLRENCFYTCLTFLECDNL